MADLLECLLQIKGLRQTIDRLSVLVADTPAERWWLAARAEGSPEGGAVPTAAGLMAWLAELEVLHGAALRLILAEDRPPLPVPDERALLALGERRRWSAAAAFGRFQARRLDNLELLEGCTAADLSRVGVHPVRRDMPLADLIAVMLASDVEHVGEIRRALGAYDPSR